MTGFEIYALLAPLQVVPVVAITLWFAHWQDARWDREQAERKRKQLAVDSPRIAAQYRVLSEG
jgi:hypothetical protein